MTRMIHREATQERIFYAPLPFELPGAPFDSPVELELHTRGPDDQAHRACLRFTPSTFDFQCKLPRLTHQGRFEISTQQLSEAAGQAQPVVIYEAGPDVLTRIPSGLRDVAGLEDYLRTRPKVFDLAEYELSAIEFEVRR